MNKHCPKHGISLEKCTRAEAVKKSLFIRIMMWLENPSRFSKDTGKERMFFVCPKGDYACSKIND